MRPFVILAIASLGACILRHSSAARRFHVWAFAFLCLLLAPFAALTVPRVAVPSILVSVAAIPSAAIGSRPVQWLSLLVTAGTVILLLRAIFDFAAAWRLVRRARHGPAPDVLMVDRNISPLAWCFGRPSVILPLEAETWPPDRLRSVLLHERAHLARGDGWWLTLARVGVALHWWNPLVWWAWRQLRIEMERACDDTALASGDVDAADYAEHLVSIASGLSIACAPGATAFSNMEGRVMHILNRNVNRSGVPRTAWWAAAIFAGALVVPLSALQNEEAIKIGQGVTRPKLVHKVEPGYTDDARDRKIAGTVVLSTEIDKEGFTDKTVVTRGLDAGLDMMALEAVRQWHFAPATRDGKPVRVQAMIEVNFRLK